MEKSDMLSLSKYPRRKRELIIAMFLKAEEVAYFFRKWI